MKILLPRRSLILLFLGTLRAVVSFSVLGLPSSSRCDHKLAYKVYGGEVFDNEVEYIDEIDMHAITSSPALELIETLSQTRLASLARLACAFAPPDQGLHLQDLASAQVVNVDEHHVEISAIMCQEEECLSVFVPVEFLHPCYNSPNVEECILLNIEELDGEAQTRIVAEEQTANALQENDFIMSALAEEPMPKDVPLWWAFPEEGYLADECRGLKELLNEPDFANDLQVLATQHIGKLCPDDVLKAAVAAVGPSGMLLRAQVRQGAGDVPSSTTDQASVFDLPIAFAQPATVAGELRSFVIGLVEESQQHSHTVIV